MDISLIPKLIALSDTFIYELFFNDEGEDQELLEKVTDFAEETVPRMSDKQFQNHFRLNVETFEALLSKCYHFHEKKLVGGNQALSFEKQVMIFIWYLTNLESFGSVADRFGVSKATAWQSYRRVSKIILQVNSQFKYISWPEDQKLDDVKRRFFQKAGFPGVVGSIDSSHIPICAPSKSQKSYINRKGFNSVLLQGVCDSNKLFTDCYTGEAGSITDACLFYRSDLYGRLTHLISRYNHLLGDSAYPLKDNMMVPYDTHAQLTQTEENYNDIHAKTRVVIEETFALLKGRFRRLKLLETVRMDLICVTVMCGCILHNLCILNRDDFHKNINLENELEEERLMNANYEIENEELATAEGVKKRNKIASNLPIRLTE